MLGNSLEEQLVAMTFRYLQHLRWAPRLTWGFRVGSEVCLRGAFLITLCSQ